MSQSSGDLCILYTYLEMRVRAVIDANSPALGQFGLFICEDDRDVAALDEDVAGSGAVISVG